MKYYDDKKIWRNLLDEANEIDEGLYYHIKDGGLPDFTYYFNDIDEDDVDYIELLFFDQRYDKFDEYDIDAIRKIKKFIENYDFYNEMKKARLELQKYIETNPDADSFDEKYDSLHRQFESFALFFLWGKYIFTKVVDTLKIKIAEYSQVLEM